MLLHLICTFLLIVVAAVPSASANAGTPAKDKHVVKAIRHPPVLEDIVRCNELYQAWSSAHSNDGIAVWNGNEIAELAVAACDQGDVTSGTKMLEQLLLDEAVAKIAMKP